MEHVSTNGLTKALWGLGSALDHIKNTLATNNNKLTAHWLVSSTGLKSLQDWNVLFGTMLPLLK